MQLKYPRDITAQDLPLIESPFFAADRVRSVLSSYYAHERSRLTLPSGILAYGQDRGSQTNQLCSRVRAGELLLVYSESERRQLFSPVVSWRAGDGTGSSGQWVFHEDPLSCPGIRDAVAGLNRNGVTPRDLNSAMGVGGAKAAHIDSEVRRQKQQREESPSPDRREPEPSRRTIIPPVSSASAAIAAELKPDKPAVPEKEPPLEIVAGLFTDGTLNNVDNSGEFERRVEEQCPASMLQDPAQRAECEERLKLLMGESYANAPTNVAKLWQLYRDSGERDGSDGPLFIKVYSPGAGTNTGGEDSIIGMATGLGETGVPEQVRKLFHRLADQIESRAAPRPRYNITFDLFGFSRGAAAARHAVNQILEGQKGEFGKALTKSGLQWPEKVTVRFLGLFDTVAGIVNLSSLDLSPGNSQVNPLMLAVDPHYVGRAFHLIAKHEKRANFSLNSLRNKDGSLPNNFCEIEIPGSHSDVGGGYVDQVVDNVLLYPTVKIRGSSAQWPRETMEWDGLDSLRHQIDQEKWIGEFSLDLPNGAKPNIRIEERRIPHPVPDGQVELSLRMQRYIDAGYSKLALRVMYDEAVKSGVLMYNIDAVDSDLQMPNDLKPVYNKIKEAIANGIESIDLESPLRDLVLQKYTHHSDHYNFMEKYMADTLVSYEFPMGMIHPFRSTLNRKRIIHPNIIMER